MKQPEITIVVPIYNEEDCLDQFFQEMDLFLAKTTRVVQVCFVNDGSTDRSLELLEKKCLEHSDYRLLSLKKNSGLSAAISAGIQESNSEFIGYIDADLQTKPSDFLLFYDDLSHVDLVTGIRQKRKDTIVKKMSSKIANAVRKAVLNDGVQDSCCPLKIGRASYLKKIPKFKGFHRFIPMLVQMHGGTIKQIPIKHYERIAGVPKYHLLNRLIGPFVDMLAMRWLKSRQIHYEVDLNLNADSQNIA